MPQAWTFSSINIAQKGKKTKWIKNYCILTSWCGRRAHRQRPPDWRGRAECPCSWAALPSASAEFAPPHSQWHRSNHDMSLWSATNKWFENIIFRKFGIIVTNRIFLVIQKNDDMMARFLIKKLWFNTNRAVILLLPNSLKWNTSIKASYSNRRNVVHVCLVSASQSAVRNWEDSICLETMAFRWAKEKPSFTGWISIICVRSSVDHKR